MSKMRVLSQVVKKIKWNRIKLNALQKQSRLLTSQNVITLKKTQNIVYIIYFIVYECATETDSLDKN